MATSSAVQCSTPVPVIIAVPGCLVTLGLQQLLESIPGAQVTGTATCRESLARTLREQRPKVLVVDPELLAEPGPLLDLTDLRVLHLSSRPHCGTYLKNRACGYVSVYTDLDRVCDALSIITACNGPGGQTDSQCLQCPLGESLHPERVSQLTPREQQVFSLIGQGFGPTACSKRLSLSIKTIEAHCENIKRKLGLANAQELADRARRWCRGETIDPVPAPGSVANEKPGSRH